jgi:alkylation response protein AidB-like acyl-CoA dehydrogenase
VIPAALTDEHRLIREAARQFAEREVAPYVREWDRAEEIDRWIVGRLASAGYLGATVEERHGGAGLDVVGYAQVIEELGRVDNSVRGIVSVSAGLVAKSIVRWASEEQKASWLPRLCAGEALGCFALTEPESGSDPGSLRTVAERIADGWRLNGSKVFITNGTWAGLALVFARTGEPGPRGLSCFLVPCEAPGWRATPIKGKLGLRGQDTAEVAIVDLEVPEDAVLGDLGDGFKIAMSALDGGRISLAASCTGTAQASLDAMVEYGGQRRQFGRPIARFQLVQEQIAEVAVDVSAARLLTLEAALKADRGEDYTLAASTAKYFASEAAVRASNAAIQVFGGYGYVDEYPVGKQLRDARVTTLYEGTSQIQKLIIGRSLTGENAFA